MRRILLISRDSNLQSTRSLLFQSAGYATLLAAELCDAVALASHADLALIGQTFNSDEQDEFIERAHETNPGLHLLCLRGGLIAPEILLKLCENCLAAAPGAARARVFENGEVVLWSKNADASTARRAGKQPNRKVVRPA